MRITRYTDYSLRVLIYLAVKSEGLATIKEIADSYGISKNHLMKVVYELNQRGYVETIRGKGGGLRLRRVPEEIRLGRFIRETEQDLALVECFGAESQCRIGPLCGLRGILSEALEAFFDVLDRYTLADLIGSPKEIGQLLGLGVVEKPIVFANPA